MSRIVPSTGVVALKGGKVLLVRHGDGATHLTGVYGLPAGKIKPGEQAIEAAKRELTEETGLITSLENLKTYTNNHYSADIETKSGEVVTYPFEVFYCLAYEGEIRKTDETEPIWMEVENLKDLDLLPNVERAINEVLYYLETKKLT